MKYIYYKFFRSASLLGNTSDLELSAWFGFSMIQIFNVIVIREALIDLFPSIKFIFTRETYYLIPAIIMIFNYNMFVRKEKYKLILEKYQGESVSERIIGNILTIIYVFVSIIFLALSIKPK